jgi:hypothetical protein
MNDSTQSIRKSQGLFGLISETSDNTLDISKNLPAGGVSLYTSTNVLYNQEAKMCLWNLAWCFR